MQLIKYNKANELLWKVKQNDNNCKDDMCSLKKICINNCIKKNKIVNVAHLEEEVIIICKEIHKKKFQDVMDEITRPKINIHQLAAMYNMFRMFNNLPHLNLGG